MKLTMLSPFSGQKNTLDLPISEQEFDKAYRFWKEGAYIQDAFPNLSADHREFIKTGITPTEWKETFGVD